VQLWPALVVNKEFGKKGFEHLNTVSLSPLSFSYMGRFTSDSDFPMVYDSLKDTNKSKIS
jgi:hypothetical protein